MVNYYDILKVSSKASNAEIKSAYRKLARKLHPDKNDGDESKAMEFAKIAKAYEVLGNPKQRADYDRRILDAQYSNGGSDSLFGSDNPHARRWRQMVYEKRYNEIIDRMIADERRESVALQKIIFPVVALFVSIFAVLVFKPKLFAGDFLSTSDIFGKIILVTLSVAGVIHLYGRVRTAFEKFTYSSDTIHDSIFEGAEPEEKPFSKAAAAAFFVGGLTLSLGAGWLVGNYFSEIVRAPNPRLYSPDVHLEMLFYPTIVVLVVGIIHWIVSRFEN